ncbi:hypothetical protein BBK36DRAFT_1087147, partial [Trichoderma citrinoviride]
PHYTQRKDLFPMQGGCPCGHIRYQLALPPLLVQTCHCTLCQRQTGSAFAVNAIVESSAISLLPSAAAPPAAPLSKADAQQASSSSSSSSSPCGILPAFAEATNPTAPPQTSSSSPPSSNSIPNPIKITLPTQSTIGQTQSQCPRCHAPLWNAYADLGPHGIYLLVGTLDAPWELPPDVHIFVRSSRRDLVALTDGKPQFEGQYPDRAAFYRPEVKERAERLAEKQKEWRQMIRAAYKARFAK